MKLWIIDDSNSTASAVLEPAETEALAWAVTQALFLAKMDANAPLISVMALALRLSKLGLQIEGL